MRCLAVLLMLLVLTVSVSAQVSPPGGGGGGTGTFPAVTCINAVGVGMSSAGVLQCAPVTPAMAPTLVPSGVDVSSLGLVTATHLAAPLPVLQGGTGIISGISGGLPYFTDATHLASSPAMSLNAPLFGGGAGAPPITGTRSGTTLEVATVLGAHTPQRQLTYDASGNVVASGTDVGEITGLVQVPQGGLGWTNTTFTGTTHVLGTASAPFTAGKQVTFDAQGNLIASVFDVGAPGGGGSGTVVSGQATHLAFYPGPGTGTTLGDSGVALSELCTTTSVCTGYQASLGFVPENPANKSSAATLGTSNVLYPTQAAVKTYVDTALTGYQPSLGFTPENPVNKSSTVTLGTSNVLYPTQGAVKSYVDTALTGYQTSLGFVPENPANKSALATLGTSNVLYPTQGAVKSYVDTAVASRVSPLTSLSVLGTANEVTVAGGTQTLEADRTWTVSLPATLNLTGKVLLGASPLVFEGATANGQTTTISITEPTGSRTLTIPDANSVTVQPTAGASNQFVTAISTSGVVSIAPVSTSTLSDGSNLVKVNVINTFSGAGALTGLPTPSNASDVATKSYVDSIAAGFSGRTGVRSATTAPLIAAYFNGPGADGVGATLTNVSTLVALSLDGVLLAPNDRVLVKDQAAPSANGIYTVTTVGTNAVAWVLTRATDYDQAGEVGSGSYTLVGPEPTTLKNTMWIQTTAGGITMGTTPLVFNQMAVTSPPLTNIPDGTVLDNKLKATAVTPPAAAPIGFGYAYFDSASKNWAVRDDAGVVKHGVQSLTAQTSQWVRSLDDAGLLGTSQPAFSDLSGTATAAQVPTLQNLNGLVPTAKGGTGWTDTTVTGTTHRLVTAQATLAAGKCLTTDASGNLIDTGSACGTSGNTLPLPSAAHQLLVGTALDTAAWKNVPNSPGGIGYDATTGTFTSATASAQGSAGILQIATGTGGFATYGGNTCTGAEESAYGISTSGQLACRQTTMTGLRPLLAQPDSRLPSGVNLGALTSGLLRIQVASGIATTSTVAMPNGTLVGTLGPQELSNTRINYRTQLFSSTLPTLTPDIDDADIYVISDLQQDTLIGAPDGTARAGQLLFFQIRTTAPRAISWDGIFSAELGFTLPTGHVGDSLFDIYIFQYNSVSGKFALFFNSQVFKQVNAAKVTPGQYICPTVTVLANGMIDDIVTGNCTEAGGGGGVPLARTLTVNGTTNEITVQGGTQDLTQNRTWTVSLPTTLNLATHILAGGTPLVFDGATAGGATTSLVITNPTANRSITVPDANSVTVQPNTAAANQFVTSISTSGVVNVAPISTTSLSDGSNLVRKDQANAFVLGGSLTGLPTPTQATDAATKAYVDGIAAGFAARAAVRVATPLALNASYGNGSQGVNATLTNQGTLEALVIDGVTVSANDRVLVSKQTAPAQNGIYVVTAPGSGAISWLLTRATDYDETSEVVAGSYTLVGSEGTQNKNTMWIESTPSPIILGTTAIVFNQLGAQAPPLTNIPDNTILDNKLRATAVAMPGTPSPGFGYLYFDGASKNWAARDDAGFVKHGVKTVVPSPSQWLTGVDDAGDWSKAPVAFSDLTGQATAAQVPNLEALNNATPLSTAKGGTGITDLTFGGTTHKVVTESGAFTAGHCLTKDANGNIVSTGQPCGTGTGPGPGTATPAGSTGDVQFNDNGNLAADTGSFNWDMASNHLTLAGLDLGGTSSTYRFVSPLGYQGTVFPPLDQSADLSYTWPSQSGELCVKGGPGCGAGGSGYATVMDETTALTAQSTLAFTGAGVTCTNNGGLSRTICDVPGVSATDALADGATKGLATFNGNDFSTTTPGVVTIDYANAQTASALAKGFLSNVDWTTFNNKVGPALTISTTAPLGGGGDLSANRTLTCATCTTNAAALTSNQLVLGDGGQATATLGSLGTTTTVLHGNAAGAPTFGAVNLTTDVTGRTPYANIAAPSTTSLLLGRGASAGDWQEITLGANLSMSGTTLNATGGGGAITSGTANGAVYATSSTAATSTGAMTNGQVLMGNTGAAPTNRTLTTLSAKSGAYTVTATDFYAYTTFTVPSGTFSLTLPAAAPSTGTMIAVVNYGTGVVTIARNGLTINGSTSNLTLPAGTATSPVTAWVWSDGGSYFAAMSEPVSVLRSIYIPAGGMDVEGSCALSTSAALVTNGPRLPLITCTDSNTDGIDFEFIMPDGWNAGTITVELAMFYAGTTHNAQIFDMNFSGQCVRHGDVVAAWAITSGATAESSTNVEVQLTASGTGNRELKGTTNPITLSGTCAGGAHVYLHGLVDATSTTFTPMNEMQIVGAKIEYTWVGSD